jgi:hypothetical protein
MSFAATTAMGQLEQVSNRLGLWKRFAVPGDFSGTEFHSDALPASRSYRVMRRLVAKKLSAGGNRDSVAADLLSMAGSRYPPDRRIGVTTRSRHPGRRSM